MDRCNRQLNPLQRVVQDRRVRTGDHEGGGRVLGGGKIARVRSGRPPLLLELLARVRDSSANAGLFVPTEPFVHRLHQFGGVPIGDPRLHRQHPVDAVCDKRRGKTRVVG